MNNPVYNRQLSELTTFTNESTEVHNAQRTVQAIYMYSETS